MCSSDLAEDGRKSLEQIMRAGHLAGQRFADTDRQPGRGRLAFFHHIEVVVERRDLVDLRLGESQFFGQRCKQAGRQMAFRVLDTVKMLDQQIPPTRLIAKQLTNPGTRLGRNPAPFWR